MDSQAGNERDSQARQPAAGYEPPRVERVLTPPDLEREVLYAGAAGSPDDG